MLSNVILHRKKGDPSIAKVAGESFIEILRYITLV